MINKCNKLFELIGDCYLLFITYLPGYFGNRLRYRYYKKRLKNIGNGAIIDVGVQIIGPEHITIGDNTYIDKFVILNAGLKLKDKREIFIKENRNFCGEPGELIIGNNVHIAPYCLLSGIGGMLIGNDLAISAGVKIYSFSHHYRSFMNPENDKIAFCSNVPSNRQCLIRGPVVIEDNSGVAVNSVILPGVTIFEKSFVGINSIVYKDVASNSVVSGMPAKFIKKRFEK